MSGKPLNR